VGIQQAVKYPTIALDICWKHGEVDEVPDHPGRLPTKAGREALAARLSRRRDSYSQDWMGSCSRSSLAV